jgi:broad specificity polyphosphatase/5'/3'-nucleotidase SurE
MARHTNRVIRRMTEPEYRLPVGHFWNINFPAMDEEEYPEKNNPGTSRHRTSRSGIQST